MKRVLSLLLIFALMLTFLASCGGGSTDPDNSDNPPSSDEPETPEEPEVPDEPEQPEEPETPGEGNDPTTEEIEEAEIFKKYSSCLLEIGDFYNGLACFRIKQANNNDLEKLGFIDVTGKVIIQPIYRPDDGNYVINLKLVNFKDAKCVLMYDENNTGTLLDASGNVLYTVGKNGVSAILPPSYGYVCVETAVEEFTGYVHTVTYYSATDFRKIAEFPNCEMHYTYSAIEADGGATLVSEIDNEKKEINIKDYDPTFGTDSSEWTVDLEKIEAFQGVSAEGCISNNNNTLGRIATVKLTNKDNISYFATVDQNGNVLMAPQKNIAFGNPGMEPYGNFYAFEFCKDLCPAYDQASGYWGYIDPYGNWKIEPQYSVARSFTTDGYALVNDKVVIDTTGKVVLCKKGWKLEAVNIVGKTYSRPSIFSTYYITFGENGDLIKDSHRIGKYTINGSFLKTSGFDPRNYFGGTAYGVYHVYQEGNKLIIGETEWTLNTN